MGISQVPAVVVGDLAGLGQASRFWIERTHILSIHTRKYRRFNELHQLVDLDEHIDRHLKVSAVVGPQELVP